MNREIKIRTYSEKLGKYIGEWGVFHNPIDESFQAGPPSGIQGEIYHEQFTGLRDSKGVEIFEGDVVKMDAWKPKKMKISFIEGAFCLASLKDGEYAGDIHYIQYSGKPQALVIGTIHDAEYKELAK